MRTTTGSVLGTAGTTAAIAAALLFASAGTAEAGKKKNKRDVELVRPTAAPDADATGILRITTSKRGEKGLLKLRNLDAKTRYEVHDADTDEVLGIVRTNRRGKAKMKLRRKVRSAGKKATFDVPDNVEICRLDDDAPLLVGETDAPEREDAPAFGFAHYEGATGWSAFVDMFSFTAEEMEGFHLSVSHFEERTSDDEPPIMAPIVLGDTFELFRDTMSGDELPLGVDSVADLSGRAFRVTDGEGAVLVRGVLPALERPEWKIPEFPEGDGLKGDWPKGDWPDWEVPDFPDRPDWNHGDRPNVERPTDERDTAARKFGGLFDELPEFDFEGEFPAFDKPNSDEWDFIDILPPDFMPFPMPEREESDLRLEIADENGDLTDVGALDRIVYPEIDWTEIDWTEIDGPEIDWPKIDGPQIDWPEWECPMDGDHVRDHEDQENETDRERDAATDRNSR